MLTPSLAILMSVPRPALGDKIDAIVRQEMRSSVTPALSLVVLHKGRVVKMAGYGFSNLETKTRASADTVYENGSMGKMFTAAALMRLVEAGKVSLEDPFSKFFPEAPPSWSSIKIRHLLNHTSGLPDYLASSVGLDSGHEYSMQEVLEEVAKRPLDFPAGAAWSYSNTGYLALGFVLEKVTGTPYEEVMKTMVFEPLGMQKTLINDIEKVVPNRAAGYYVQNGEWRKGEERTQCFAAFADGGMITTVRDLAKWDVAILEGRLLKPSSWNTMMSPGYLDTGRRLTYGFGWFMRPAIGKRVVDHGGNMTGFNSYIYRDLTTQTTIITLANVGGLSARRVTERIAQEALPETAQILSRAAAPSLDIAAKIRTATESWLSGKPDKFLFSPDFVLSWNTDRLKATLLSATKIGSIKTWTYSDSVPDGEETLHRFSMATEKQTYRITATVLKNGEIGGLSISRY